MYRTCLVFLLAYLRVYGASCEDLAKLKLPHTTVEQAETVAAGASRLPSELWQNTWAGSNEVQAAKLPAFCRVSLKITPVPDSEIGVEVRLPIQGWNKRLVAVGNGGRAGQINWRAMSRPLSRGYAVASTDTGHRGRSSRDAFADGHPEKVIDFAHRSIHEMAFAAKLVVKAYYGAAPKYAYWNGSSTGGRQGLKAAQMYPEDFDGIVSGAPVIGTERYISGAYRTPLAMAAGATPIAREKLKLVEAAATRQCDMTDGLEDGVIGDPTACRFDPASLQELTPNELAMFRTMYQPFRHPVTKIEVYAGYPPGSERGWRFDGDSLQEPPTLLEVRNKPGFDRPVDLATDIERIVKADGGEISAGTTDMRAFFKRGGKLMLVHGWIDPQVSPLATVKYYQRVLEDLGPVHANFRLFMVPGMAHSRGGLGVNDFDSLTVMEQWVERGQAPNRIIGRRLVCALNPTVGVDQDPHDDAKILYTRPLCPWPQVARYAGSGNPNDAANFACVSPAAQAQRAAQGTR